MPLSMISSKKSFQERQKQRQLRLTQLKEAEEVRSLRLKNVDRYLNTYLVRHNMHWGIPATNQTISSLSPPWSDITKWKSLRPNQQWERRKKYNEKLELYRKNENWKYEEELKDMQNFKKKFRDLLIATGKVIAYNYGKQYRK